MNQMSTIQESKTQVESMSPQKESSASQKVQGAILLNLGTPDAPQASEVRQYLREFLMDPYVIDIPLPVRWLLVNGVILPTRPSKSAEAYQKIWTDRGSPLLFHLLDLVPKVQQQLGSEWRVLPAMRYGKPGIESVLSQFQKEGITDITVFPLYPQYSLAATETSVQQCQKIANRLSPEFRLKFVGAFYNDPGFIRAFAEKTRTHLTGYDYDHVLFSFHGLPERHVKKTDLRGDHCLSQENCCAEMNDANRNCYRAQCFQTAHAIARQLGLEKSRYTVCFQSRLGRNPWIKPYTDHFYESLPARGAKKIAVVCPAFVADCLETLEEIEMRGKEEFVQNGGEDLKLVPSLNSDDVWAQVVANLLKAS